MHNLLKQIIQDKGHEVAKLRSKMYRQHFKQAMMKDGLSVIGEIKRKSPSKGVLANGVNAVNLAEQYVAAGVSAISVLTDKKYFGGSIEDLNEVSDALKSTTVAVLRKDFVVDPSQIVEALLAGADAVLLIVAVLHERTKPLMQFAKKLGLDCLVEVHTIAELEHAIEIGADIRGINNRDLETFEENIEVCLGLLRCVPEGIVTVAESAIRTPNDFSRIQAAGFDGALIGEALVKARDPAETLSAMRCVA